MALSIQRLGGPWTRRIAAAFLALAGLAAWPAGPQAHPIPESVTVQIAARPQDRRLRVLVQVPVAAMRDIAFPTLGNGEFLDLSRADAALRVAAMTWLAPVLIMFEGDRPIGPPVLTGTRFDLPSDRSFVTYDSALAHFQGPPLAPDTRLPVATALFTAAFDYAIESDRARFSVEPQFARLGIRVLTVLRFALPEGGERVFTFGGDPGLVRLDPRWHQAAARFVALGFEHILTGLDHLLFLLCLVLPVRRFWQLAIIVTAFTVAHSITLFSAAFGLAPDALWFPPLVETLIAASIVYMALENIVMSVTRRPGADAGVDRALRRRWAVAFAFGLVHGFGFSFALHEKLQLAGSHLVTSLVAFNVGVELGQVLVLAVSLPIVVLLVRRLLDERVGIGLLSALVAHTAWHWMAERGAALRGYDWNGMNPAALASALRWMMLAVAIMAALWFARRRRR